MMPIVLAAIGIGFVAYMMARVLTRMGYSPLWAATIFVPPLAVAGLWWVALNPWPRDPRPPKGPDGKPMYH